MKVKLTTDEKVFNFVNYTLLIVFAIIFLYPIVYVFSASFSNPFALETGQVTLLPKGFTIQSFIAAATTKGIWRAYANSIFITVVGTIVNMLFTVTGAYVLSKEDLPFRKFFVMMVVVTMWFDPGMIPRYLNFKSFGLLNTYTGVILGFAVNTFNVIILKSFFESVPKSLEESARIDGAGPFRIMMNIYLPLSGSALTTVSLFYAISRWNGYFWSMVILQDNDKAPLQVFLKKLIVENAVGGEGNQIVTPETLASPQSTIYAIIVLSLIPMLILYPFIQKFFKKGVTVGAVKG